MSVREGDGGGKASDGDKTQKEIALVKDPDASPDHQFSQISLQRRVKSTDFINTCLKKKKKVRRVEESAIPKCLDYSFTSREKL